MAFPKTVKIVEVGPRDGLQNEAATVPAKTKIEFIDQLSETGLTVIEATSFVSPKWVPQLADNREVYEGIRKKSGVRYPVLIPNLKGLELAILAGVKDIAVFTTPSEQFSRKNTNCSVAESLDRINAIIKLAKQSGLRVRGYVSCVLGCPYEGEISPVKVAKLASNLYQMGCDEISLGDTIGVGTPLKTTALLQQVMVEIDKQHLAVHFHDTFGLALVNIYAALAQGIHIIDSSVAGLGGCPYAKGATGNVATEDVLYLLEHMGIETGVDFKRLLKVAHFISTQLHRPLRSKVGQALLGSVLNSP